MATTASSEVSDGPVLSLINKRIRGLRKKQNRISQMEESLAQGKTLNNEQLEVLRTKSAIVASIDELEKLRQPLSVAVAEEISLAVQVTAPPAAAATEPEEHHETPPNAVQQSGESAADVDEQNHHQAAVEELLNLLYFGSLFDVKTQSDFTSIMFTRSHERGCCLTYDTVTDDDTDMLAEKDLDLLSSLSGLLISRPVASGLSHKNALQRCIEHAKLWLANSDQPIEPNSSVTYVSLRERLSKIMASDYFTITPEMKAPEAMAAAAGGNFAPFQVRGVDVDSSFVQFQQQKGEEMPNLEGHDSGDNQSGPVEEVQKDEFETENFAEVVLVQHEQIKPETEVEHNERDVEFEQHNGPRRQYQNQRGGRGGGRRGYSNGRGGRGRGGGSYQNGQNQFYDQPGNYYSRNYNRARGGRGGGPSYNNHGSAQDGHASANIGVAS
ncbi:PREDICTED: uncharacterized protein LOC101315141 isoform X1 [Fragaria vesca subsp. vesca]|uniref:uncharacterized protein LOC101315141 isoform X1 n=1 Tax=Fragaria vesca subsp. vesca TaxID=101020 RepID=UPI0002C36BF4|nr:PREDICTED: uncharacterized protein LOC101315141 isoform X1 [Fragaria vesca subsp. vesca]